MSGAPTVITLTAIPPRFAHLGPTLDSLLAQDLPAPVELWLPRRYRRFPDWDGTLPGVPPGVAIRRCETDYGPATKVLPAALERRGQAVDLLFADDDAVYAPDLHRRFKALRAARPAEALAAIARHLPQPGPQPGPDSPRRGRLPRMRRRSRPEILEDFARLGSRYGGAVALLAESGYADTIEGWGGVMIRPDFLAPAAAAGPGAHWAVDDIWLSAMLEAAGTPIWAEAAILPPQRRSAGGIAALAEAVLDGSGRKALDAAAIAGLGAELRIWHGAPVPRWRRLWRGLPAPLRNRIAAVLRG